MTKNATTAQGEAMPSLNRRAVLVGLPAAAAVAAIPHKANGAEPQKASPAIRALIQAHREAWQAFEDACSAADQHHPSYGGPKAERLCERLDAAEARALNAIFSYRSHSMADQKARARYLLRRFHRLDLATHPEAAHQLLRSLAV